MNFVRGLEHAQLLLKEADEDGRRRALRALKPVGMGALGLGTGLAVGHGLGRVLEKVDPQGPVPGARVAKYLAPAVGTALGVAHSVWRDREQKAIRDALERSDVKP